MVGQDLDPRPDDEDHEEQVEEVLGIDPPRQARMPLRRRSRQRAGVAGHEPLHCRHVPQALGAGDGAEEHDEAERHEPQQVEPPFPADSDPRGDAPRRRQRSRPGLWVDDVFAAREALPEGRQLVRRSGVAPRLHWRGSRPVRSAFTSSRDSCLQGFLPPQTAAAAGTRPVPSSGRTCAIMAQT
jgi:hypothetical protein